MPVFLLCTVPRMEVRVTERSVGAAGVAYYLVDGCRYQLRRSYQVVQPPLGLSRKFNYCKSCLSWETSSHSS